MNKEKIGEMIDKNIIQSLVDGHAIGYIKNELERKMNNFASKIKESDKSIDLVSLITNDPDKITTSRVRYQVIYIQHCMKRIKDLDWVFKNKSKYSKLSRSQVFSLLKLKEKLQYKSETIKEFSLLN